MSRYSPDFTTSRASKPALPVERLSKSFGGLGLSSQRMQEYPNPYYLSPPPPKPVRKNVWHHECAEWENMAQRILSMFSDVLPFSLDAEASSADLRMTLEQVCQNMYKISVRPKETIEFIELKEKLERTKSKLNNERKLSTKLQEDLRKLHDESTETIERHKIQQAIEKERLLQEQKEALDQELEKQREETQSALAAIQNKYGISSKLDRIEGLIIQQQQQQNSRSPPSSPSSKTISKQSPDGVNYIVQVNNPPEGSVSSMVTEETELDELSSGTAEEISSTIHEVINHVSPTKQKPKKSKGSATPKTQIFFMPPPPSVSSVSSDKSSKKKKKDKSKKPKKHRLY